jgi:transmembrane sensor
MSDPVRRAPLREIADLSVDDATVQRMWRAIGRRRARSHGGSATWAIRGGVAVAGALAVALLLFAARREEGPLRLVAGAELGVVEGPSGAGSAAAAPGPKRVDLSDGSTLLVGAEARLRTLQNTSSLLVAVIEAGRVTFDVEPRGPRRWVIECGLATLEVAGTRFTRTAPRTTPRSPWSEARSWSAASSSRIASSGSPSASRWR